VKCTSENSQHKEKTGDELDTENEAFHSGSRLTREIGEINSPPIHSDGMQIVGDYIAFGLNSSICDVF